MMVAGPWVPFATMVGQDQTFAAYPYLDGSNQTVAVVDRGVDYRHPQLGNNHVGTGQKIVGGYNFRDKNYNILDDYGHGTGVVGIIASDPYTLGGYNQGVAVNTHILMLKQESSLNIKDALDWVIQYHAFYNIQVINLTDFITDVKADAYNAGWYSDELKTLNDLGIFVSTPVGNGELFGLAQHPPFQPDIQLPAISQYVFGAGGFTQAGVEYNDSLRGAGLDLLGPALDVTMPYYLQHKVNNQPVGGFDQFDDNYTGTTTLVDYAKGSSWASAYTSGTAVLLKQIDPTFTPTQIANILTSTGISTPDNENANIHVPRLNMFAAVNKAFQMADDSNFGNSDFSTATKLTFSKGVSSTTGRKLIIGHPDFYTFNVTKTASVNFKVNGSQGLPPFSVLFDANHNVIAQLNFARRGQNLKLAAGKYYVYFTNPQTYSGTYSLVVSGVSGTLATPAFARPAVGFSTTPITAGASVASQMDVLLGKNQAAMFA